MNILISGKKAELTKFFLRKYKKNNIYFVEDDFPNIDYDFFFHIGASKPTSPIIKIIYNNIIKNIFLLFVLKKYKIKQSFFFSSISVYGKYKGTIHEKNQCHLTSLYSYSKFISEKILIKFFNKPLICLRLPAILLKNSDHYIASIINNLKNNKKIILGTNYNKKFNFFLHPLNLFNFLLNLKKIKKKKAIINISSKKSQTLLQIVNFLKKKSKSTSEIQIDKNLLISSSNISNNVAISNFNFKPWSSNKSLKNF